MVCQELVVVVSVVMSQVFVVAKFDLDRKFRCSEEEKWWFGNDMMV